MKVKELAKVLNKLPQNKEVAIFYDGAARGEIDGIVDDTNEIVIVTDWSIYRDGEYRAYEECQIVYERNESLQPLTFWQRWLLTLFRERLEN